MTAKKVVAAVKPHVAPIAVAALLAVLLGRNAGKAALEAARAEGVDILTKKAR